jgi:hypothetical protein
LNRHTHFPNAPGLVVLIKGEVKMFGMVGDGPTNQRELEWAEIGRGDTVPTLWLQKLDFKRHTSSRQVF